MPLFLLGLNHRTAPLALREQLFLSGDRHLLLLTQALASIDELSELVCVSTCNRLELYGVCEAAETTAIMQRLTTLIAARCGLAGVALEPHLYTALERGAVEQLLRVACGLDSMVLGEMQILGQVSSALASAQQAGTAGVTLNRLFMDAVHAGKRARTETAISQHTTSVSHVAALLAQPHLGRARRALLLGAGEMARSAASALLQHGAAQVIVANRTYDAAQALAEQVNAALPAGDERVCAIEWSRLWNALAASDVVMTATAAPHTLLHAPDLRRVQAERGGRPLVLIDIAVPRNVDPLARTLQGVTVFDMDDLQRVVDHHLAQRQACVPQVEAIIAEASQTFAAWLASRRVVPVIKDLRHRLQAVVQDELALAMTRLNDLDDAERAVLQRFAHRVVNKLLHAPTATLHERANSPDAETYAGVLREMFALDQADTARGA